ncbi:MAG: ORF6N domain-containing protein [Oligoflexia bacterium]|nr:ORF6N domain-containing protein [Oligoflexia bacterium]
MNTQLIQIDWIQNHIFIIRNQKVMLSHDLASLYQVEPKVLVQAVKRNLDRFPDDFMFQLGNQEFTNLKSQIVTSSWGGIRKLPYAFTEQGIAMLSGVLHSPRAVQVNIEIMRAFVSLRRLLTTYKELAEKLTLVEKKYDHQFKIVFDALREIMKAPETHRRKIGIHTDEKD